jgi:hypothetical protein
MDRRGRVTGTLGSDACADNFGRRAARRRLTNDGNRGAGAVVNGGGAS